VFCLRLKNRHGPYTIVMRAVFCAFWLLLTQVMLVFLYKVLPAEWLDRVFRLLKEIPYLRMVLYYASIVLVILMFGGMLKSNKCPGCSFAFDPSSRVCPSCGPELKDICPHCGSLKMHDLPYCPNCGGESGAYLGASSGTVARG